MKLTTAEEKMTEVIRELYQDELSPITDEIVEYYKGELNAQQVGGLLTSLQNKEVIELTEDTDGFRNFIWVDLV